MSTIPPPPAAAMQRKLSSTAATAISAGSSAFHTLKSQVGGHPGVLASEDNALIVKACLHVERTFYERLATEDPSIAKLQPYVPRFYGTLRLEGRMKGSGGLEPTGGVAAISADINLEQGGIEPAPDTEGKDNLSGLVPAVLQSIVLENVSAAFTKPNVLDIKLGTILYEDGASEEKKQRMLETARNTTSLETGVRLTGFQVYDHTTKEYAVTPKAYGKSIKPVDLPDGIRRFFPLSPSPLDSAIPESQGLPLPLLLPILKGLLEDLKGIRTALAETELRLVGASFLIAYEADWAAARTALEAQAAAKTALTSASNSKSNLTGGAGAEDEDDKDGYDSDLESEEEEKPAYALRLIDFAHTKFVPGEGPDERVLKGVDTTITLFEGRIKELEGETR